MLMDCGRTPESKENQYMLGETLRVREKTQMDDYLFSELDLHLIYTVRRPSGSALL